MNPPYCFVLIHSPLVGPFTWSPVAEHLRARHIEACVPPLNEGGAPTTPYWQRHAESVAGFLRDTPPGAPIVLTAHSGAGSLLPAIRAASGAKIAAYLFVDAGVPVSNRTRLESMERESPESAAQFRRFLEAGGQFPDWRDEQLRELVPDDTVRRQLLSELNSRGLDFYSEPISVFVGWPDAPCGYIRFSQSYRQPYAEALRRGWVTMAREAGHFHLLVEPEQVAEMMLEIVSQL